MKTRTIGGSLIAAATLFLLSWLLMPGVGVTDAKQIFALVSAQRPWVLLSVALQLCSSALYVPGLVGLVAHRRFGNLPGVRLASGLLILGAMGSAADAVLHLLAYAMTRPGSSTDASLEVMTFMQGPGLVMLAPLILCFFVGGGRLSYALSSAGLISRRNAYLHWLAIAIAVLGGVSAPGRAVGLLALSCVSWAQAWVGWRLFRYDPHAVIAIAPDMQRALGERATLPAP